MQRPLLVRFSTTQEGNSRPVRCVRLGTSKAAHTTRRCRKHLSVDSGKPNPRQDHDRPRGLITTRLHVRLRQRHSLSTVSSSSLFCPTALLAGGRNAARLRWRCLSLTVGARASEDICRGSIPSADRFLRFTKACLLLNSSPESPLTTRSQSTAARVTGEIGDNKINSYEG